MRKEGDAPSTAFSSDQLQYMVGLARTLGLHVDVYDLSVISTDGDSSRVHLHGKPTPPKARAGRANAAATAAGLVSLDGCTPHDIPDAPSALAAGHKELPPTVSNGILASRWCGVRVTRSDVAESTHPPIFGVLCPSSTDPKQKSELLVLPYNFPVLLPLLQQAKDISNHSRVGQSTHLPQKWQASMGAYLRSVPPYYFPSLYRIFTPMGLNVFISLLTGGATASLPSPDISLSRQVQKYLARLTQRVKTELAHLDPQQTSYGDGHEGIVDMSGRGGPVPGGFVPGIETPATSSEFCVVKSSALQSSCRNSFVTSGIEKSASSLPIPHMCGAPPAPQDLLYAWERTRSFLYGGSGHSVRGVHVPGLHGASSGAKVEAGQQQALDWFYRACGGAQVPRMAV